MKLRNTFKIAFAFAFAFIFMISAAQSQTKKHYIVFNNLDLAALDINVDIGGEIITLWELLYNRQLTSASNYKDYFTVEPFAPVTFAKYNIAQDFDFAVFPVGDYPLHASIAGVSLIEVIKEMLANGKGVLLIGRQMLRNMQDARVQDFFVNELGVQFDAPYNLSSGDTFTRYDIEGAEGDVVRSFGIKTGNQIISENNSEMSPPWFWYHNADFFKLKNGAAAIGTQRVMYSSPQHFAGLRYETEFGGKLYMYSVGFDAASKIHTPKFMNEAWSAFDWFTSAMPHPEQFIVSELGEVQFSPTEVGKSSLVKFRIRNNGRKKLTVSDIRIADPIDVGVFELIDTKTSLVLNPGDIHTITIKFTPTAERGFSEVLEIDSDAINAKRLSIFVEGSGGTQILFGPIISVSPFPFDFGDLSIGQMEIQVLPISNTGNETLIIDQMDIVDNPREFFIKEGQWRTPETILPGATFNLAVKFFPIEPIFGEHKAKVRLITNAKNADTLLIDLVGRVAPDYAGPQAVFPFEEIQFGNNIDGPRDTTFYIENSGDIPLFIASVAIDSDFPDILNNDIFVISEGKEGTVQPGEKHEVVLEFNPTETRFYTATRVVINSNSNTWGLKYIPVSGTSIVSVGESIVNSDEMNIYVNPNPTQGLLNIDLEIQKADNYVVSVFDILGNRVMEISEDFLTEGSHKFELNFANTATGVYQLVVTSNKFRAQVPIVIEK